MARCDCRRIELKFDEGNVGLSELHHSLPWLTASPSALAAAAKSLCQDPGSEEERHAFEDVLRKCADSEIQKHADHLAALPLQLQIPRGRQNSAVSSLATTPFASTLVSRSTSRSSGTDSLPITPATEVLDPLNGISTRRETDTDLVASRALSVSHTTTLAFRKASATDDVEARLLHMEQLVDLYLLSHHRHQAARDTALSANPWVKSFSKSFVEELFEEGDTAKRLVELQRAPEKGKVSWRL